jgi:murein DD-endopeptidase MepM/ murein hydrolase activator NlpD
LQQCGAVLTHTPGDLASVLKKFAPGPAQVVAVELQATPLVILDLTEDNAALRRGVGRVREALAAYVARELRSSGASVAVGRYAENRVVYGGTGLFDGEGEPRTVHLGVDLFLPAGTGVLAALDGTVHSLADNRAPGDYGPTVVLEHLLHDVQFYTLYGHMARASLRQLRVGQRVRVGEAFGALGDVDENGGWPPHLHFQLIDQMCGRSGDYPGVARRSEQAVFLRRCPNPNWLLQMSGCW